MCFCENDDMVRVGACHDEGEGPFTVGDTINVEKEDVESRGFVGVRWEREMVGVGQWVGGVRLGVTVGTGETKR